MTSSHDSKDTKPVAYIKAIAGCPVLSMCGTGLIMIIFMMISVSSIMNQINDPDAPAFPTTDNSGFLDINDINSLAMNAVTEGQRLNVKANEVVKEVNVVQAQQSIPSRSWGLTMLFKTKDGSNILVKDKLKIMRGVEDAITSVSGYSDFCLKADPAGAPGRMADVMNLAVYGMPTSRNATCASPTSILSYLYPSTTSSISTKSGSSYFVPSFMESSPLGTSLKSGASVTSYPIMSYDGRGNTLAPCSPDPTMSAMGFYAALRNMTCPMPSPIKNMINTSRLPPYLKAVLPPATLDAIGSCNLCNNAWCACDAATRGSFTGSFAEGGQTQIDAPMGEFARAPWLAFLMGREFSPTNLKSQVTLYTVNFGQPLAGFKNTTDGEARGSFGASGQQTALFTTFAQKLKVVLDKQQADNEDKLDVLYFWPIVTFQEILNVLLHDGLLAIGSVMFVGVYIHFHTGSSFLAAMGMFHIFMSFPLAFFFFRFIFGIVPFYTLSFLSIYVVLAIGADDVFVFVDAWKQSGGAGADVNVDVVTRMSWTYRRAVKAMLVTSLTTFGAFAATSISPLNDVSTFGLFTALLVAANYLFVCTWYPAVVLVYHKYFESRPGCCCCLGKRKRTRLAFPKEDVVPAAAGEAPVPAGVAEPVAAEGDYETFVERFFRTKYVPLVNKRNFQIASVSVMTVLALVGVILASQLGPTTKEDQILPDWHPFQRIISTLNNDFAQGSDTPMRVSDVAYGMDPTMPLDRTGLGRYDVGGTNDAGKINWDATFDLSEPTSQTHFIAVCDALVTQGLVRTGSGLGALEVACPMQGLKDFVTGVNAGSIVYNGTFPFSFPVPKAQFATAMTAWIAYRKASLRPGQRWLPHQDFDELMWFDKVTQRMKYAVIRANTTLGAFDANYSPLNEAYKKWGSFVTSQNSAAPGAAINKAFLSGPPGRQGGGAWVFLTTQKLLVSGAVFGALTSGAFAFVILTASTMNPFLALLSILDIIGIVACILGSMVIMGWELGVIESVSVTVLVGLSVDYVVHLANSYIESSASDRAGRVAHASTEMGVTVFGGAITSLGASFMLFLCYFQFFFKFGCFMFLTISLSFIWAFFFFLPVSALCGPQGNFCSIAPAILFNKEGAASGKEGVEMPQRVPKPTEEPPVVQE